jgi:Xaa-Pro aminopeptidase
VNNGRFKERRRRLAESCDGGVIAVPGQDCGGSVSPNFVYLTGLAEPRGTLLLIPEGGWVRQARTPGSDYLRGRKLESIMFLPPSDPLKRRWGEDGVATLDSEDAVSLGVDALLPVSALDEVLRTLLSRDPRFGVVRAAPAADTVADSPAAALASRIRERMFGVAIRDDTSIVIAMRMIKDADEIRAIERAATVTAEAFAAAREVAAAGMREYEVEAELIRVYRRHGGIHAFDPIVAGGPRAGILHYRRNDAVLRAGELLLVDSGCSLDGYAADVTRTWSPGGTMTARQQEVYDAVLRAEKAAIDACRPGRTLDEVHKTALDVLTEAGFGESFPHGTSHHLGLETHDASEILTPLAPGMVITVEPGVYLDAEGIGVRIEDDILVTEKGPRILTASIPK